MGCDIHVHIEQKVKGRWIHHSAPRVKQWYALFAKMAGVRGDEDPISEPKGIPDDISETTALDLKHYDSDAHSGSWLNEEEIHKLQLWIEAVDRGTCMPFNSRFGFFYGNDFHIKGQRLPEGVEDVRFVFWFDN